MSIELKREASGKILIVNLSGKLTKEDYAYLTPAIEDAIKAFGKVRMMVRMHDFHGWSVGALWEDFKFDLRHFADIERLALVGDKKWEAGMAVFCKPFTTAKVRYFDESRAEDAAEWIHEDIVAPVSVG